MGASKQQNVFRLTKLARKLQRLARNLRPVSQKICIGLGSIVDSSQPGREANGRFMKGLRGCDYRRNEGKVVDEELFGELKKLTKVGAAKFSDEKFIEGLRRAQASGSRG